MAALDLVVVLYVWPGQEAAFTRYESIAAAVMREHHGAIERALRCAEAGQAEAKPYEIHWLRFRSQQDFDDYRADERLAELSSLRATAICRTELWIGQEISVPSGSGVH